MYRNMFEWNQQLEVIKEGYKPPEELERTLSNFQSEQEQQPINFDKLSTLTMLALNLPYITCPDFEFDQDLGPEELPFKFKQKKLRDAKQDEDDQGFSSGRGRVLYDGEKN